jgi:hypothetical protein
MPGMDQITMLSPVALRPQRDDAIEPIGLSRSLAGVSFGLEIDYAWECYRQVIDEWRKLLERDGATTHQLWVENSRNDKMKKSADQVRDDIAEWSKLVECGVVGLGN